tara:strand:+ start:245 stop:790 length:546 start_codon:yes stop_codon:yes gene_type:complete
MAEYTHSRQRPIKKQKPKKKSKTIQEIRAEQGRKKKAKGPSMSEVMQAQSRKKKAKGPSMSAARRKAEQSKKTKKPSMSEVMRTTTRTSAKKPASSKIKAKAKTPKYTGATTSGVKLGKEKRTQVSPGVLVQRRNIKKSGASKKDGVQSIYAPSGNFNPKNPPKSYWDKKSLLKRIKDNDW